MDKNTLTVVVLAVAAFVVCAVGWLLVPSLQDSRQAVDAEALVHIERARRLLDRYDANLTHESLLTDMLSEEEAEPDPDDVSDNLADEYQQIHAAMWTAYPPIDWAQGGTPRLAKASYGNVAGQVREGLRRYARLVEENDGLLDEALNAVDQALSVTRGGESARSNTEANHLKGTILQHMGLAEQALAQLVRREADSYRRELIALAAAGTKSKPAVAPETENAAEGYIARLDTEAADLAAGIASDRKAIESLDAKIKSLEDRLSAAQARRAEARNAMRELQAAGIDFSDPNGAEVFRVRLEAFSQAFREASREAHDVEFGTVVEGGADQADIAAACGIQHYRNERNVLAITLEGRQRTLDDLHSDITRLRGMKEMRLAAQAEVEKRVAEAVAVAPDVYDELNRIESEAFTIEDGALDLFDESADFIRQATRCAEDWVSQANERTRDVSPVVRDGSAFGKRLGDGWMGGYITAQEADVLLAKAWIHYARYIAATQNAKILGDVTGPLGLKETDIEGEKAKAQEARDAGVEEITRAMRALEEAHRETGRQWTITAQAAGATYLVALFGYPDYIDDTIEAYRSAITGRENEDYARCYVSILDRLERR